MNRYLLTTEAANDLDLIKNWLIRQGGHRLALGRIQSGTNLLARVPGIGHLRADLTDDPVKFWQVFSWLIVYDPAPRPIHIVRVLHSSQDIAEILS